MIDTGNTLALAVKTLHEKGAKSIHALISHGESIAALLVICKNDVIDISPRLLLLGLLSGDNSQLDQLPMNRLVVRACSIH